MWLAVWSHLPQTPTAPQPPRQSSLMIWGQNSPYALRSELNAPKAGPVATSFLVYVSHLSPLGPPGVPGASRDGHDGAHGEPGLPGDPGLQGAVGAQGTPGICDTSACQGAVAAGAGEKSGPRSS